MDKPAEKWMINRIQRSVARDIASAELPYEVALESLQRNHVFENWTAWEMDHRPVDVDALRECVEQEVGLW